jgi:hypothetical protein
MPVAGSEPTSASARPAEGRDQQRWYLPLALLLNFGLPLALDFGAT